MTRADCGVATDPTTRAGECSPAIVAQINLVNNFTGSGVVKSFYVPYFCSECDEEKSERSGDYECSGVAPCETSAGKTDRAMPNPAER